MAEDVTRRTLGQRVAPPRFLAFVAILVAGSVLGWQPLGTARALLVAFDVAAAAFLLSLVPLLRADQSAASMQRRATENDANRGLLLVVATTVVLAVLGVVYLEVSTPGRPSVPLVIGTLALAWLFANTVYALHYAHRYYDADPPGGLGFPGSPAAPGYWDFLYFAFTMGMTFQTSDTTVETPAMRRIVLGHGVAAFAFNIGVLAFTINTLGGG